MTALEPKEKTLKWDTEINREVAERSRTHHTLPDRGCFQDVSQRCRQFQRTAPLYKFPGISLTWTHSRPKSLACFSVSQGAEPFFASSLERILYWWTVVCEKWQHLHKRGFLGLMHTIRVRHFNPLRHLQTLPHILLFLFASIALHQAAIRSAVTSSWELLLQFLLPPHPFYLCHHRGCYPRKRRPSYLTLLVKNVCGFPSPSR